jgi:hypothetical protein
VNTITFSFKDTAGECDLHARPAAAFQWQVAEKLSLVVPSDAMKDPAKLEG